MITTATTGLGVIVGVDGSQAAVEAARWAADEALDRGVPLRLLAVIKASHPSGEDYHRDLKHAQTALQAAHVAVDATGKSLKVETEILRGRPGASLVAESRDADMLCVGTVGIGRYSRLLLGSTATAVAEKAHCPVAVIRSRPDQPHPIDWIVVAADDAPDSDAVVDNAMREAQLRKLPVLAIGAETGRLNDRLQPWLRWYPDVHVYPVTTGADVSRFVEENDDWAPLVVVGSADAGRLAHILGPQRHPVFRHTQISALVVRN
jgi:nucleotide-binding universal stress UspA family protein